MIRSGQRRRSRLVVQGVDPVEPGAPVSPVEPVEPEPPVSPVGPVEPVGALGPEGPVGPAEPLGAVEPPEGVELDCAEMAAGSCSEEVAIAVAIAAPAAKPVGALIRKLFGHPRTRLTLSQPFETQPNDEVRRPSRSSSPSPVGRLVRTG
jgi:hypothetical protein